MKEDLLQESDHIGSMGISRTFSGWPVPDMDNHDIDDCKTTEIMDVSKKFSLVCHEAWGLFMGSLTG